MDTALDSIETYTPRPIFDTSKTPIYKYSPLPNSTSIRILEFLPKDVTRKQGEIPLRCSMIVADLEDSPLYDALSYTWGCPLGQMPGADPDRGQERSCYEERKWPILCDGCWINVTANLWDFLLQISFNSSGLKDKGLQRAKYIWIDALCINQKNMPERSSQVMLMDRIYSQAQTVIVWLGAPDKFTDDAVLGLYRLGTIDRERDDTAMINGHFDPRELGLADVSEDIWAAIFHFINRTWFNRAWVIQETVLADKIIVLCGAQLLPWNGCCLAFSFLHFSGWDRKLAYQMAQINGEPPFERRIGPMAPSWQRSLVDIEDEMLSKTPVTAYVDAWTGQVRNLHHNFMMRSQIRTNSRDATAHGYDLSLESLLQDFRSCQATDNRDKIYAFLGVARSGLEHAKIKTQLVGITPNYLQSMAHAYTEAAWVMLRSAKNLRLLSHVQDSSFNSTNELPSWVPDYSTVIAPKPLEGMLVDFCAAGNLSWDCSMGEVPERKLTIQGFIFDVVKCCGRDNGPLLSRIAKPVEQLLPFYGENAPQRVTYGQITSIQAGRDDIYLPLWDNKSSLLRVTTKIDALWRTMTADTLEGVHPAPQYWQSAFSDWVCIEICRAASDGELIDAYARLSMSERGGYVDYHDLVKISKLYAAAAEINRWNVRPNIERGGARIMPDVRRLQEIMRRSRRQDPETSVPLDVGRLARFITQLEWVMTGRRLFSTGRGYLGSGPWSMQVGDCVAILAGANYPFVLREVRKGHFKLIGEAYVHGIMHGEAVERADFNLTSIVLE